MRNFVWQVTALVLCLLLVVQVAAQGNTFDKVRYNGGTIATKISHDDWDNRLTVTSDLITFALKDGQSITILPSKVTSLSYGQEAHRRVGTAVAIGVFSLGIGALSALHKTKLHFIGINYVDKDDKKQGLLLQGDKGNFRAILVALQGATGVPVAVGDKDRNEVPVGIPTTRGAEVAGGESKETPGQPVASPGPQATSPVGPSQAPATVDVTSTPDSADIYVDGSFVGDTPAALKLKPGKHAIRVSLKGYVDWSRETPVESGSEVHLTAPLQKQN